MTIARLRMLLLGSALLMLCGCARSDLLQALDERQANEVVAALLHNNIHAEKQPQGKAGFAVRVAAADLAAAIDLVQQQGLPSRPRTQIAQAFPADAMVSTPLAERARLLSAIEQRLEESLATLEDVQQARVHVSYDATPAEGSLRPRVPPSMHVAAVLVHAPAADVVTLVAAAKRFLRNAFVDVSYDDVSVVLAAGSEPRTLAVTADDDPRPGDMLLAASLLLLLLGLVAAWHYRRGGRLPAMRRAAGPHAEQADHASQG